MSIPVEVAFISEDGQSHLQRLMASWGILSDLSFADLLLFVPARGQDDKFVAYGQMRPTTSQTLHHEDLVGRIVGEDELPLVARAWRLGEIVEGEGSVGGRSEPSRVQCIPVRSHGQLVAVLARESPLEVGGRRPGQLERIYVETFDRLARMIVSGDFPFVVEDAPTAEAPRVGDGVLLLDATGRVEYASPNSVNALHRMGIFSNAVGLRLDELGVEETAIQQAFFQGIPVTEEVERPPDAVVLLRCVPLLEAGEVTGALVLSRDVTDLRRRDRLLVSKDATIREVHHRVKNNLQTISSLLRLQARRLPSREGRFALEEAERRIRSIALVHEILSREPGEQAALNEIVEPLVRMAQEGVLTEDPVVFAIHGDPGEVPAELATPLAVVLTELLQNAAEHAFPVAREGDVDDALQGNGHAVGNGGSPDPGRTGSAAASPDGEGHRVDVFLRNDGEVLQVQVHDNGQGLPPGFSIETTESLGLSIVRDLVTGQLGGTIEMHPDGGTRVDLMVPMTATRRSDL